MITSRMSAIAAAPPHKPYRATEDGAAAGTVVAVGIVSTAALLQAVSATSAGKAKDLRMLFS